MLEKPNIQDQKIIEFVHDVYDLVIGGLDFISVGHDVYSAVYCLNTVDNKSYFLKLSGEHFSPVSVWVPKILKDQGIDQVIAPIRTKSSGLWSDLDLYKVTLYPFIKGKSGKDIEFTEQLWREFGEALKNIHSAKLPNEIINNIPRESFSPYWREKVKAYLIRVKTEIFEEPIAVKLAVFIKSRTQEIHALIERAEKTGKLLKEEEQKFVLCHADIHTNNILIEDKGKLYIVNWDTLIFAPKEKDLMYIGGGIGGAWNKKEDVELFYKGYGKTEINTTALAYFRYERIIEDIAEFCDRLLLTDSGWKDLERSLDMFMDTFSPNNIVNIAMREE